MQLLDYLACDNRPVPDIAVGFSLGGNILLHHARNAACSPLKGIMTVSTPFDMRATVDYMGSFYNKRFVQAMKKKLHAKLELGVAMPVSTAQINALVTLRDVDNTITAPMWGHVDANAYYDHASAARFLSEIQTPTLMIHAKDDPFVPVASIPGIDQLSEQVTLELHDHGGHVGFVQRRTDGGRFWLPQKITRSVRHFSKKQNWA
jgi:predicted alpha/beta-fold hydrolase